MLGGSPQKFELWIILLPLAQRQQEILPILGSILSGMLYHSYFCLGYFFRKLRDILLWIWFF